MSRRFLIHAFLILSLTTSVSGQAAETAPTMDTARTETARRLQLPMDRLPDHVLYGQMFRHVVALDQWADILDKRGEDGSKFRLRYKQSAELSDREDQVLKDIARGCVIRVTEQDRKAIAVIRAVRAQHPDGVLAAGELPPAPPPELAALQEERNAIILEARDRLRQAFGEEEFARLDSFVRQSLGPHIRQTSPEIPRSSGREKQ